MHLPKVIAHRGASQIAPENSLQAFKKAHELGATWLEFDVMLTKDHIAIIHHDHTFKRILNLDKNVHETLYEEIKDSIPTLDQTLIFCANLGLSLNIELKTTQTDAKQTALETLKVLKKHKFFTKDNILFSSQEIDALKILHEQAPEFKLGLVADHWSDVNDALPQLPFYALSLHYPMLTQELVTNMRNQGYKILAFTVNDRCLASELFNIDVCSIFSDNPSLLN